MNDNQDQLSLGNLCKIIKELAQNKSFANQTEVFYTLFDVDNVSDSTINNYCVGYRSIGSEFKHIYTMYKNKFAKDITVLDEPILRILSILDGDIYTYENHEQVERLIINSDNFQKMCFDLYNLAKNDTSVKNEFTEKIYKYISENNFYLAFCYLLFYIILEKKQPIYIEKEQLEVVEKLLNNTNIAVDELEKMLKLQMRDGINYFYSLKKLASEGNSYACFELGNREYRGEITGSPRYIKAYEYFLVAADKNHPRANWLIARMYIKGWLTGKPEYNKAWDYLIKAKECNSIAALNTLGLFCLNGYGPGGKKDLKKAIAYFKEAAEYNYVYAYNNLGLIYEKQGDYQKAFDYYRLSANLEESWACNRIAEFYRKGIVVKCDMKKAFDYYNLAINVPISILEYWPFYNLAKYFYLLGNEEAGIEPDLGKAITLLEIAADHGIDPAYEELIYIYIDLYLQENDKSYIELVNEYLAKITKTLYYLQCQERLREKLTKLEQLKPLQIKVFED